MISQLRGDTFFILKHKLISDRSVRTMSEHDQDLIKAAREWMRKMDNLFQGYHDDSLLASIDQFFYNRQIPVFVKNTDEEWIATFQIPGVTKDRIDLNVVDNRLIVRVKEQKIQEIKDDQKDLYHFKQYDRAREAGIQLPGSIIPSSLTASFDHGLLKVKAKKQAIKRRNLSIE